MNRTLKRILNLFFSLALVAGVGFAWIQRQAIYDWFRLRNYTPPAAITKIASNDTMKPLASHIFYVYHPELDDKSTFNQHCGGFGEQTIVLGCYVSPTGIYIYDVQDQRLSGVKEVTGAHEMLHAAYDRLSNSERQHIDALINQAYAQVTDQRIRANIDNYRKQGADVTNELHSILGTEVRDLPPELEQYYSRYFTNREQVVSYSEQYESYFTSLQQQSQQIQQQLSSLKNQINNLEASLSQEQAALEADRSKLTSPAQAEAFNARVRVYNAQIGQLNQLINQYNSLVDQYKQLAIQQQQLYQAIDSRTTIQGQ